MTRTTVLSALAVVALAAALVGCGGSSSSSSTTTSSSTTPPPPTTTAATGANTRLTNAQWTTYQTANKTWASVNTKGIATFRACNQASHAASPSNAPSAFAKCLGSTPATMVTSTQTFGTTLHGFQPTVTGQCTTALNDYIGSLVSWQNIVAGVQHSVSLGQLPSTANAQTAYDQITSSATAFAKACRPVSARKSS